MLQVSLQLDESTETTLKSQLVTFACYAKGEKMKKEFLFCNNLATTTKAADVKLLLVLFLS